MTQVEMSHPRSTDIWRFRTNLQSYAGSQPTLIEEQDRDTREVEWANVKANRLVRLIPSPAVDLGVHDFFFPPLREGKNGGGGVK